MLHERGSVDTPYTNEKCVDRETAKSTEIRRLRWKEAWRQGLLEMTQRCLRSKNPELRGALHCLFILQCPSSFSLLRNPISPSTLSPNSFHPRQAGPHLTIHPFCYLCLYLFFWSFHSLFSIISLQIFLGLTSRQPLTYAFVDCMNSRMQ